MGLRQKWKLNQNKSQPNIKKPSHNPNESHISQDTLKPISLMVFITFLKQQTNKQKRNEQRETSTCFNTN